MLTTLIATLWPYLVGAGAFVMAIGAAYLRGSANRGKAEAAKRAAEQLAAAQDRLEMNREATDAEKKVASMSDDEARKEAMKWARR